MESHEHRVGKAVAAQLKEQIKDKPHRADPKNMEQLVKNQGSARVYCMVGHSLAEAMKPLLK